MGKHSIYHILATMEKYPFSPSVICSTDESSFDSFCDASHTDEKICIIRLTPYFYFPEVHITEKTLQFEPVGGMQVQIAELTRAIDRYGIEQTVVTTGVPGIPRTYRYENHTVIHSVRLPLPPIRTQAKGLLGLLVSWGVGSLFWSIHKILSEHRGNINLVHCHCSELPWTFLFAPIVAKLLGAPLVLTVHCSALATIHPETNFEKAFYFFARLAEKKAIRVADWIITLTDHLKQFYINMEITNSSKIDIIPDGIRCDEFLSFATPDNLNEFRNKFRIPNDKNIILFVGRIAPEKGWIHFIEAANILGDKNLHFLVCGDGNQKELMERMILELKLKDKFTLTGFIPHKQVACAIALSEMVVMPSLHEEMGGTILETMTLGKPIIATTVGGIPEVIQHAVNGWLVKPGDSSEVALAISTLLKHPELVASIGKNGIKTVRERFDMNKLSKDMIKIYKRVIKKNE